MDVADAHGEVAHWEEPLLSRALGQDYSLATDKGALIQMNCNICHRYDRETKGADAINLAKRLVEEKGCRACHTINNRGGHIGPDLTRVGEKAPEQYDFTRLSGQRTSFAWHVAHLKDPRALATDTVMPNFNFTTEQAQALAMLILSWRPADVPAEYVCRRAATRHADAGTGRGRGAHAHWARRMVRADRMLRLPFDLGAGRARARRRSARICRTPSKTCSRASAARSTTSCASPPARCPSSSRGRSS